MLSIKYFIAKLLKKINLPAIKSSKLDKPSFIGSYSHIVCSEIGSYSYIGSNCTIVDVNIGKFCSIADNCIIGGASHPINWLSTSPVFHEGKNILKTNFSRHQFVTTKKTIIENDVWIGNNVLIKSGVHISNGAIIGMGSVVTKDIGEYEIWGGNPAKLIRTRFDVETIDFIKNNYNEWWNWDSEKIMNLAPLVNKIDRNVIENENYSSLSK